MFKSLLVKVVLIGCLLLSGCTGQNAYYTLTVESQGEGIVTPFGSNSYLKGTTVELKALPEEGWEFHRWLGPVAEPFWPETIVLMEGNFKIQAVFVKNGEPEVKIGPGGIINWRADGSQVQVRPGGKGDIEYIMLHAISDGAVNPTNPYRLERIRAIFDEYGVESHFAIDRDGSVYRFVADDRIAHHAGAGSWGGDPKLTNNMNRYAIGIELLGIGTKQEMQNVVGAAANKKIKQKDRGYTKLQYRNLELLLQQLMAEYNVPKENIITHADYDPERKWDPGQLFNWNKIQLK